MRTALEAVAASDTDGLIRLEALLSLVSAGVCNVTVARTLAALMPQLNSQSSIWGSKHGVLDAIAVLPCVPEMVEADQMYAAAGAQALVCRRLIY